MEVQLKRLSSESTESFRRSLGVISDSVGVSPPKIIRLHSTSQSPSRPVREAKRRSCVAPENSDCDSEDAVHCCMREISNLGDVFNAFAIGYKSSIRHNLASFENRANLSTWANETTNKKVRQSVFNLYKEVLKKISILVCGEEAAEASLLAVAKDIIDKSEDQYEKDALNTTKKKYQHVLVEFLSKVKKNTIAHRTVRAILVSTGTRKEISSIIAADSNLKFSHRSFTNGRKDLRNLQSGGLLTSTDRTLDRFDPANIDIAIKNILSTRNVSFVSWGTIKIKHNGVLYEFPRVTRKVIKKDIFLNYRENSGIARHRQLKRTSFFKLISLLTHSEAKVRTAVDYVTGLLVNDTFAMLNRIAAIFCTDLTERQTLEVELKVAETWLKYGINDHLSDSSNCVAHIISNGLASPISNKSSAECDEFSDCSSNYSECEDELHESDDHDT